MSEVFAAFGIDWRLLIINAVNFGLLLLVLWYFLYGPLTKLMEERRQKVANGVRDAESAKRKLEEIEHSKAGVLAEAGKQADEVLAHARASATAKEREIVASGEATAAQAVKEAAAQALELKAQAIQESKQEVAKLIVLGMERVMKEKNA